MGSIGAVMFHVVGITVLTFIAITIAAVAVPRRPRPSDRSPDGSPWAGSSVGAADAPGNPGGGASR